jgi:hypothetical protein
MAGVAIYARSGGGLGGVAVALRSTLTQYRGSSGDLAGDGQSHRDPGRAPKGSSPRNRAPTFEHFGAIVQAAGRFEFDSETAGLLSVAERADGSAGTVFEHEEAGKARLMVRGEELT